ESYMPQELDDKKYYEPGDRGLEIQIREKLEKLHLANEQSDFKRSPKG
ncbi:MAG: hypothetical protein HOG25_03430, partial [Gammaproteobacteria bacterium]|nr:hypothetical protein [Gammaproteobacteria bacterium]